MKTMHHTATLYLAGTKVILRPSTTQGMVLVHARGETREADATDRDEAYGSALDLAAMATGVGAYETLTISQVRGIADLLQKVAR